MKIIVLIGFLVAIAMSYITGVKSTTPGTPIEVEYYVELINADSVRIYSPSTDRVYECTYEEMEETFDKDNI